MKISQIFETLYEGKEVTLEFHNPSYYSSFCSQLRTAKSRYDFKFKQLFDESLTNGKVVRSCRIESLTGKFVYKFWLGDSERKKADTHFQIISIDESKQIEQDEKVKV